MAPKHDDIHRQAQTWITVWMERCASNRSITIVSKTELAAMWIECILVLKWPGFIYLLWSRYVYNMISNKWHSMYIVHPSLDIQCQLHLVKLLYKYIYIYVENI